MNKTFVILFVAFVAGDCVRLTKGVFKGEYWTVLTVNPGGTFDLQDHSWILRDVRGSYLTSTDLNNCKEKL